MLRDPGGRGPVAQHYLRRRLRRTAVHPAGYADCPARARGVSGDQAVGRAIGRGPPDRLAHAGTADPAAFAAADDAVPAAGLRDLARRGRGPRRAHAGHRRPGQPGRPRRPRQYRDQIPAGAGKLAVPAGRTPVARPRLPVDARPRHAQDRRPEKSRRRAAPAQFGVGTDLRAGDSRRHLRAAGRERTALVRRRAARWLGGQGGGVRRGQPVRHRKGGRGHRRRRRLRRAPDRVPGPVHRLPLAAALPDRRPPRGPTGTEVRGRS
jgi:hypothetical protein